MKKVYVVIFGIGNVGSALIDQLIAIKEQLKREASIELIIPIVANSKLVFFQSKPFANSWESDFNAFSIPYKIGDIISYLKDKDYKNLIAVDATASLRFVQYYEELIQNGFHIVSANKIANTLDFNFYENLREKLKEKNKYFFYETNVGAGLPVINTINDIVNSGDRIHKIRGVFSGSLSYVFNTFSVENETFSRVLEKASKLGLTEPDAREDLSGKDVARKLLILARELQLKVELDNVNIESLVPKNLNGKTSVTQFKSRIKELDLPFQNRKDKLAKNTVLRYVGVLDVASQTLEVKLISEERNSSLGQLQGADSIFEIFTDSYGEKPLVIQGAGAGKQVTARGLLSDIVKLSKQLS